MTVESCLCLSDPPYTAHDSQPQFSRLLPEVGWGLPAFSSMSDVLGLPQIWAGVPAPTEIYRFSRRGLPQWPTESRQSLMNRWAAPMDGCFTDS